MKSPIFPWIAIVALFSVACASSPPVRELPTAKTALPDAPTCRFGEAQPGELTGTATGDESELEQAQARCIELGDKCTGVSSKWYVGVPFHPVLASEPFTPTPGSYGLTYVKECGK